MSNILDVAEAIWSVKVENAINVDFKQDTHFYLYLGTYSVCCTVTK